MYLMVIAVVERASRLAMGEAVQSVHGLNFTLLRQQDQGSRKNSVNLINGRVSRQVARSISRYWLEILSRKNFSLFLILLIVNTDLPMCVLGSIPFGSCMLGSAPHPDPGNLGSKAGKFTVSPIQRLQFIIVRGVKGSRWQAGACARIAF